MKSGLRGLRSSEWMVVGQGAPVMLGSTLVSDMLF